MFYKMIEKRVSVNFGGNQFVKHWIPDQVRNDNITFLSYVNIVLNIWNSNERSS